MRQPTEVAGIRRTISISAHLLEQRNRGRLTLPGTDPDDIPLVDARMLEHPDDLAAMVTTMEFIAGLVGHPSMRRYFGPLLQPGPGVDWAAFARTTHDSYHHGVGTCKMGPASDPLAVVDPTLRVHGVENLWVADASVMPTVPHANTNLSAIMVGERVADILGALG
jgi:choline dehydrogenase